MPDAKRRVEGDMKRNLSGWGVTAAGFVLAVGGVYAMATGWDVILLERGWSLFIAGSVALSGGVVTMALGRVVAHLARLAPTQAIERAQVQPVAPVATKISTPSAPPASPAPASVETPPGPETALRQVATPATVTPAIVTRPVVTRPIEAPPIAPPPPDEPTEVDRYTAGDATYIMLSDGSVEVRWPDGAQRYPSLAALRADAESRQR
jgi:hypothetical protein